MDYKALLNQVLSSGSDVASKVSGVTTSITNSAKTGGGMSDMTKGAIGGAVGGSLVTMLLGNKKARKMGTKVAKIGGTVALGAFAYKVYNDWQANKQNSSPSAFPQTPTASANSAVNNPPVAAAPMDTPEHSMVVLQAMIAAAKADGHVDDAEQERIYKAIQSIGANQEVSAFVDGELSKPLDPAEIARACTSPEESAEVYLASLLMVDEQSFMERAYLKELARELQLDPELVSRLESQVL